VIRRCAYCGQFRKIFHSCPERARAKAWSSSAAVQAAQSLRQAEQTSNAAAASAPAADYDWMHSRIEHITFKAAALNDLVREGYTVRQLALAPNIVEKRVAQQRLIYEVPGIVALEPPGSQVEQYDLDEEGRPKTLYYASYGSNLFADRFNAYITGGQPEGSIRVYDGCRDKTLPSDDIPIALNGTIYYAGQSQAWNGGVAFLDTGAEGKALGRAYRISAEQFDDVISQEGNEPAGTKKVELARVLREGRIVESGAYGTLVHVGDYNGSPVFTFTGPFTTAQARAGDHSIDPQGNLVLRESQTDKKGEDGKEPWPVFANPPSQAYRDMISAGLKETHGLTQKQVDTYFAGSTGLLP